MASVDEIHSNLGALQQQLDELTRLKSIIDRLGDTQDAAHKAVRAAEDVTGSSQAVVQTFEQSAKQIEESEILQHIGQIEVLIENFHAVREELQLQVDAIPERIATPLQAQKDELTEATERASRLQIDATKEAIGNHQEHVTDQIKTVRDAHVAQQEALVAQVEEIETETDKLVRLLNEAQLSSRLQALQSAVSNVNQAVQNTLSRLDAAEQRLSSSVDEQRRVQERSKQEIDRQMEAIQDSLRDLQSDNQTLRLLLIGILVLGFLIAGTLALYGLL